MQACDDQRPQIVWKGLDEAGYFRGTFRDGGALLPIAITIPGSGKPPHPGPLHDIHIAGTKVGSMPHLKAAQALAELHLLQLRNRQLDKQTLAALGLLRRTGGRRS
jgi:hypothetical protein